MRPRAAWFGWLLLLASPHAAADAVADGLAAWTQGDFALARDLWLPAARGGEPEAMFLLSELYDQGKGIPADPAQAVSWLTAAAQADHVAACYNLGDRFLNGRDLPRDPSRAAHWWRRAAVQGLAQAQYNLGTLYYRGLGVSRDTQQAAWWYRQAAAQGSERARRALAVIVADPPLAEPPPRQPVPAAAPPPASQAAATEPPPPVAGSPGADPMALALGPDWLRRQPPEHYTVQVFASHDIEAVNRFLGGYRFSRQVAVYPFRKAGSAWYGVVWGRFGGPEQARRAMAELPDAVRKGRPWLRQMRDVTGLLDDVGD